MNNASMFQNAGCTYSSSISVKPISTNMVLISSAMRVRGCFFPGWTAGAKVLTSYRRNCTSFHLPVWISSGVSWATSSLTSRPMETISLPRSVSSIVLVTSSFSATRSWRERRAAITALSSVSSDISSSASCSSSTSSAVGRSRASRPFSVSRSTVLPSALDIVARSFFLSHPRAMDVSSLESSAARSPMSPSPPFSASSLMARLSGRPRSSTARSLMEYTFRATSEMTTAPLDWSQEPAFMTSTSWEKPPASNIRSGSALPLRRSSASSSFDSLALSPVSISEAFMGSVNG